MINSASVSKDGRNAGTRGHPSRRAPGRAPQDEVRDIFTTSFPGDDEWGLLSLAEGLRADSSPERLQPGFDCGAARFQKRRQPQFLAERFHRLVGGEAGPVGGDLEQDAVRLAEIKAAKIETVDLAAVLGAGFVQPPPPGAI